jgi:hypothetical protein
MKKFLFKNKISSLIILLLSLIFVSSCDNNDDNVSLLPVIEKVSLSVDSNNKPTTLDPIDKVSPGNMVIIHGKNLKSVQHIFFNDYESAFSNVLVTDTDIFVTIDKNTPYVNVNNKLKLVTKQGSVEYDFVILPPAPVITGINPTNANDGDTVTITGSYFVNPVVKIGDATPTIVSQSLTEIKVVLPTNSANKLISVTTMSGTVYSQAIGSAIYDDVIYGDAGHWTWSGANIETDYTGDKYQGEKSMRIAFGGWDGADFKFSPIDVSKYKAFRIRLKSSTNNSDAAVVLVFGGWAYQIKKNIGTEWTYIEIPFSDIGNPTTFDQITFQEAGGFGGNTILIDDMGFVLK